VSNAEADFFRVLTRVVGSRGHILAQVSLRQLLWMPGNNQTNPGRATWQNKIAAKSLDFVVSDLATLRPRVVIELDEPSHARPERQTRDEDVQTILEAARLPVLKVLTSRNYDTRELAATILPYLAA
jgi:very-short-patch-repair endonuclease